MKIKEVENLKKLLDYHNNLYYNKDTPEISDPEYDALKAKYIEVSGQEYDYVPGEAQFSKAKHLYSVRSLGKVNTLEDLHKEMERLVPFVIEPKFDGLTLVAYDTDTMVTRGDGIVGELVTSTAKHIENLKKVSEYIPKGAGIRMEVFMTKDAFKSINSEREEKGLKLFKNARNAAAGILRSKDTTNTDKLTYMAYNVLGSTASETVQLEWLCDNGFLTTEFYCCDTKEGIDDAIEFVKDFDREDLEYEIDGLVIKSNKPDSLALYGETGHHPKNAVAYKFPAEGKWTKLKGITWQVGRTGKITPVAELEPVDIGGSAITRATLHNRAIIKVLGITEGCEVFVIKANDVIPAIINVRNINPLRKIKDCIICPECGSELVEEGDQLYCKNAECSAQLSNQIVHMASRDALNIEGLSTETVNKILDKFSLLKILIVEISSTMLLLITNLLSNNLKVIILYIKNLESR
jgi:DNA ligase (NAD+)